MGILMHFLIFREQKNVLHAVLTAFSTKHFLNPKMDLRPPNIEQMILWLAQ